MSILRIAFLIFTLVSLQGCSIFNEQSNDGVYSKSNKIKKSYSLKNWTINSKNQNADLIYKKIKSESLIIVNSNCRKNNLSSLQALKGSILSGIENLVTDDEVIKTLHQRDSLVTNFQGSLDGVKRQMTLTIFQRDYCIYDIILISKNKENHTADIADYEKLITELFEF